ncbi:right-handed parallel beta-helix repeat-containing protein [Cupriavidus sp. L7L]|uniref:right-handed parallel beta-helix repeat-containing protein n=1 Tax=Cupriavidus sp. L7L TaxID=2546443 RepID=UPI001055415E|nr:right-handed parallel beta-helix repeat-containing protein [Cupriavidus sp. L7L]TDF66164.1 right-handed parallel beta-helix repeat-containing protein [Cupriavidus sp. L7L]
MEKTRRTAIATLCSLGILYFGRAVSAQSALSVTPFRGQILRLTDFGGKADWNGSGGTDNQAALNSALASGAAIAIPPGRFMLGTTVKLPPGARIIGQGGELVFIEGSLQVNAGCICDGIFISGNGRTNRGSGFSILAGANGVTLIRPKVRDVHYNAVDNSHGAADLMIINPDLSNIGGENINPTYQGCGVYSTNGVRLCVRGGEMQRTYGQGAVFVNGGEDYEISGVDIHDTYYRGITTYNKPTGGLIARNTIKRTGGLKPKGSSGVGTNGIYLIHSTANDCLVIGNNIEDVGENGIEGNGIIQNNKITRTGYNDLITPSKEGIYLFSDAIARGNIIRDSAGDGIKCYTNGRTRHIVATNNVIYTPAESGISIISDGASTIFGELKIEDNIVYGDNNTTKAGISITSKNGGRYSEENSVVRNNRVVGRSNNSVDRAITAVSGNSFDNTKQQQEKPN